MIQFVSTRGVRHSLLFGLLGRGLLRRRHLLCQDLLYTLLFFDEERAHDAHLHTLCASRATVGAVDGPPSFLQPPVLDWSQGWNADKTLMAIAAMRALRPLLHNSRDQPATWRPDWADLVRLGIVRGVATVREALHHGCCVCQRVTARL